MLGAHPAFDGRTELGETALWNVHVSHVKILASFHFLYRYIILSSNRSPILIQPTDEDRVFSHDVNGVVGPDCLIARPTKIDIDCRNTSWTRIHVHRYRFGQGSRSIVAQRLIHVSIACGWQTFCLSWRMDVAKKECTAWQNLPVQLRYHRDLKERRPRKHGHQDSPGNLNELHGLLIQAQPVLTVPAHERRHLNYSLK